MTAKIFRKVKEDYAIRKFKLKIQVVKTWQDDERIIEDVLQMLSNEYNYS